MENATSSLLRQSVGQSLRAVEGLFYVPSGESTFSPDSLDQLRITFDSRSVRLRCSGDGETLTIDGSELCTSDLGEYGELRRSDFSQAPEFIRLMNTPLRRVLSITSSEDQFRIGVMLEFGAGSVVICNWGDELKVWDKVPELLFADEDIRIASSREKEDTQRSFGP